MTKPEFSIERTPLAQRPSSFVIFLLVTFLLAQPSPCQQSRLDALRAERVGWARLKTPSEWWFRHANGDPALMHFLREQTTLNIDPTWYVAEVSKLDQMVQYPLIFSQGLHVALDRAAENNVAEYIRRGGFLLIDACCNPGATPSESGFLRQHIDLLAKILPEAKVRELPSSHPLYRCFFQIPKGHPPHTFYGHVFNAQKAAHGFYGIMIGRRLAGLITVSGLQCGWSPLGDIPPPPGHDLACMKMLANIYIYAMTEGGD